MTDSPVPTRPRPRHAGAPLPWKATVAGLLTLLAGSASAVTYDVSKLNISTMDFWNASPMIRYTPVDSTSEDAGWNMSYTETPYSEWSPRFLGNGASSSHSRHPGAQASIDFVGTGVRLIGELDGHVKLQVGAHEYTSGPKPNGDGVIVAAENLVPGQYTAMLTLTDGYVSITEFAVDIVAGGAGANVTNTTVNMIADPNSTTYAMSRSISLGNKENWVEEHSLCMDASCKHWPNATDEEKDLLESNPYYRGEVNYINTTTVGETITWPIPKRSSHLAVLGFVGPECGRYSVAIDPQPFGAKADKMDASAKWLDSDQVLYFASLDPRVDYVNITIIYEGDGQWFAVNSINYQTAIGGLEDYLTPASAEVPSTSGGVSGGDKKKTNIGAIVGGVVGGVVGLALIAAAFFYFWRRHKKGKRPSAIRRNMTPDSADGRFEVDHEPKTQPTPVTFVTGPTPQHAVPQGYAPIPPTPVGSEAPTSPPMTSAASSKLARESVWSATPSNMSNYAGQGGFQGYSPSPPGSSFGPGASGSGYFPPGAMATPQHGPYPGGSYYVPSSAPDTAESAGGYAGGRPMSSSSGGSSGVLSKTSMPVARPTVVRQEDDGGRIAQEHHAVIHEEVVPPQYNPAWNDAGGAAPTGGAAGSSPQQQQGN